MPLPSGSMRSSRATSNSRLLELLEAVGHACAPPPPCGRRRAARSHRTSESAASSSTTSMRTGARLSPSRPPLGRAGAAGRSMVMRVPAADLALHPDLAAVGGDDAVADGEAEARCPGPPAWW